MLQHRIRAHRGGRELTATESGSSDKREQKTNNPMDTSGETRKRQRRDTCGHITRQRIFQFANKEGREMRTTNECHIDWSRLNSQS